MPEQKHKGEHHHRPGTVSPQEERRVEKAVLAPHGAAVEHPEPSSGQPASLPEIPVVVEKVPEITGAPIVPKAPAPEAAEPPKEVGPPQKEPTFPQTPGTVEETATGAAPARQDSSAAPLAPPPIPVLKEEDVSRAFQVPPGVKGANIFMNIEKRASQTHIDPATGTGASEAAALMNEIKETVDRLPPD